MSPSFVKKVRMQRLELGTAKNLLIYLNTFVITHMILSFRFSASVGGPGALDPAVKPEGSLDPGVAHSNEDADDVDDDFPSENFWAGCRNIDLKDWVESVKTQPPDKVGGGR